MIPSVALQKAIYSELNMGIYPIHEVVPKTNKDLPLITLHGFTREPNFTKTNQKRFTFKVSIHGWSIGKSSIEIKEIEEFIYQTIMNLKMKAYDIEFINLSLNANTKSEETEDRVVFHSIQEFEITISSKKENK